MKNKPQDLRQRTKAFALRIINLYATLPKTTVAQIIGKQLLRSGTSVGANYHEAYRARSGAEFVSKLGISRQELEETTYWIELLADARILPAPKLASLLDEANQLAAIFTTIAKKKEQTLRKT